MNPRGYIVGVKLFGMLLFLAGALCAQTVPADPDNGFDKPAKTTEVDLGPSPYSVPAGRVRKKLTCFYYSTFTVKEYDEGQKGAEWHSIVPLARAGCRKAHSRDERVLAGEKWWGYFWGAKDRYAIFAEPDGMDGGIPFKVFDVRTGRTVFRDSSLMEYYQAKLQLKNVFHISIEPDKSIRLTYFRVADAGCSLTKKQAECWNKVRARFGIGQTAPPVCGRHEEGVNEQPEADWESAVIYPVTVLLTDHPQIKTIDGPVFCWPKD